ncbi:M20/M25/M40 family metallo-hydrolase [Aureitalea marina]|uniref:Acetylornithine deacetylase n=1 Tax=Aureitalea marina TaxID=930804 RepID=A0A2S7KN78_9FLAO|nr:M20/M25/M40 family metallo-hydrolase [Aureitalea marina]PQB04089.1 acetylornithine deacetylase [Aureitalea marina]
MRSFLLVTGILFSLTSAAQSLSPSQIEQLASQYALNSFELLKEVLSIPNDAMQPGHIEPNVLWTEKVFSQRGFSTKRLKTPTVPLVLAERNFEGADKTVLVYLQMDGQPVDSTRWFQPSPYDPVLKQPKGEEWEIISWERIANYQDDWRVFARAASDAKGPVAMFLSAIDAMDEQKLEPSYNLKVILDYEEELGSPNLPQSVKDYKTDLMADMLVIFDGPMHISNRPTLVFGARGIATIELTVHGPVKPQHSGHYGNYAPNPAFKLARLLTSMKDEAGRVTIPGFYDGISIDNKTVKILRDVPDDETEIRERLQIAQPDQVGSYYQEAIQYPSLNVRGMQSGWINEEVRTIIPSWAKAEIDVRLVLESDPERLIALIKEHIQSQGYFLTSDWPTKEQRLKYPKLATFNYEVSYQSFRTDFDSEVGTWLRAALIHAYGEDPVMERLAGGSIPISPFVVTLDIPAVSVPTVNRDNNQHSPNENLRLGNYREGIRSMLAILTQKL